MTDQVRAALASVERERQVRAARVSVERRAGAVGQLEQEAARTGADADRLRAEAERHAKVNVLLTGLAEQAQARAQVQLEQLVTRGLQVIFGTELSFHVNHAVKAGQLSTEFTIRSAYEDRVVDTPVLEARGGGMAAVVGFMLRLVVLLLTPGAQRLLLLDEAFAHLSREFEPRLAEFLREVCEKAAVQVLLVSHSDAYDDFADARLRLTPGRDGEVTVS